LHTLSSCPARTLINFISNAAPFFSLQKNRAERLTLFSVLVTAAEKLGLPLLKPSKQGGADFKQGANMAIIGATTMDSGFFQSLGIGDKIWNNGPLNTQIQWFQQLMPSICGSTQGTRAINANHALWP
jgi:hypothetical protein